jgi:hypothetical protein
MLPGGTEVDAENFDQALFYIEEGRGADTTFEPRAITVDTNRSYRICDNRKGESIVFGLGLGLIGGRIIRGRIIRYDMVSYRQVVIRSRIIGIISI